MRNNVGKYLAFSSLPPFPARRGRKRVLIEGAGIAGLSLALFLKRFLPERYETLIVEKRKEGEVSVDNERREHGGRKRGYTASK
jgi:2-polyprenyl-6-methoxyphenol hydroxylase-like FAD-dependent oxidoreductase